MGYRSELEARLAKKTTKAIVDYQMLDDGDRVMVGLSGGKDSWALLQVLDVLRQRAPIKFSLVAVNVDSGYKDYKHDVIARTCEARGWEYRIEHTGIGELIEDILDADQTPCSLCARFRRGVLYRIAKEVGATKIALGHHADDFIETLLLNLFFAGALKAMPAKLVSDDGAHVVIRPLVYVGEDEARLYTKERGLPIIGCCCPAWEAGLLLLAAPATAQQRPLVAEDPEPVGAGRILLEGGVDFLHDQQYPVSGLAGNLWRVPTLGVSVGISSIAELQIDGGLYSHLSISS